MPLCEVRLLAVADIHKVRGRKVIYIFALIGFIVGGWGVVLVSYLSLVKGRKIMAESYSFPMAKDRKRFIWHG